MDGERDWGAKCQCPLDLLDWIVLRDGISKASANHARAVAQETNEPIDRVLSKLGLKTESQIAHAYSDMLSIPIVSGVDPAPSEALGAVNPMFFATHRCILVQAASKTLQLALVDPTDEVSIRGIEVALGQSVQRAVITDSDWRAAQTAQLSATDTSDAETDQSDLDISADANRLRDLASEEPVVQFVNALISSASAARASDVHIEPADVETIVRFRVDGALQEHRSIPIRLGAAAISRIKILSQLDIAEQRRPQDGRFSFPVQGRKIDLRVSTVPTQNGESLVLRLLDSTLVQLDYGALGFSENSIASIRRMITKPHGVVLVTGPTGSGKTTTLYTMLSELSDGRRKLLTIEDPVEYHLPGVSQTQTNAAIDLTFAKALRSFLRHDPDVIMVGEIRDLETARIAIQAALTGHLVLSTLHTNSAPGAITRLLDMGIEDFLIGSAINGVIAQRLAPKLCACVQKKGPAPQKPIVDCAICHGTGSTGRIAISETLEMDEEIVRALKSGADESTLKTTAHRAGYAPLYEDALEKARTNLISPETAQTFLVGE